MIDLSDSVQDATSNPLDGLWTNPTTLPEVGDTFPSGDGTPGGAFQFRFNVLPGNADLGLPTSQTTPPVLGST